MSLAITAVYPLHTAGGGSTSRGGGERISTQKDLDQFSLWRDELIWFWLESLRRNGVRHLVVVTVHNTVAKRGFPDSQPLALCHPDGGGVRPSAFGDLDTSSGLGFH